MSRRVSRARLGAKRTSRGDGCNRLFDRRERSEQGQRAGRSGWPDR
jgi:hypothetical protein